jgi:hypothetical protein
MGVHFSSLLENHDHKNKWYENVTFKVSQYLHKYILYVSVMMSDGRTEAQHTDSEYML